MSFYEYQKRNGLQRILLVEIKEKKLFHKDILKEQNKNAKTKID